MANIRKSFNFRSGLQVDNDNFVINENGLVGIGTSAPSLYKLNIYGDTRNTGLVTTSELYAGVGTISNFEATNANITGVLTATQLNLGGQLVGGNFVGYAYTAWITSPGDVGLHTLSSVGVGTTAKSEYILDALGDVNITGDLTATNLSGALAATNISGTLTNNQLPSNITATFTGDLTGTATTASSLSGTPNISVSNIDASGIITATTGLNVGTDFNVLSNGRVGIGTELPTSELQIRKSSGSLLEVVSDSGQSRISIGQSVGVGNSTAVLRFGNSDKSFDIINRDTGNINFYLHSGTGVGNTGDYRWYYGKNLGSPLMSLTYGGNLGLGKTNPDNTLHVVGTSTITSTAYFGGDIRAKKIYFTEIENGGIVKSNTNITSGISTFYDVEISNSLGIGTDNLGSNKFRIKDGLESNLGTKVSTGTATVGDTNYFSSNLGADSAELKVYGNSYVGSDLYVRGNFYGNFSGTATGLTGTPNIEVGIVTANSINSTGIVTANSINSTGIVTANDGFTSGGPAVEITVTGSTLTFTVVGVGSTSLNLI